MIDLTDELTQEYFAECREHLVTLEADLLTMEKEGANTDEELINRAFRAVHSVKGGAGFFDLTKIPQLAHQMEDLLSLIRSGKMIPTSERIRILLSATDRLHELILNPGTSDEADITKDMAPLIKLHAEHKQSTAPKASALTAVAKQQGPGHLRMLVVEDDFTSRLVLQTFLSKYGECHVAMNGKEAVAVFCKAQTAGDKYDLICMDIMMPEMDGQTAVQQIRAFEEGAGILSTNGAKIVMTTALDDVKNVVKSFRLLCDGYLFKPINTEKLLGHMRNLNLL
jgi:two-component system chemotaxis response regulator CheY